MPVDVSERFSTGWWLHRLSRKMVAGRKRYDVLDAWYRGDPPVRADEPYYEKYRDVVRQSRTAYAALPVHARRDRMQLRAVRTSVDQDLAGDEIAWSLIRRSDLDVELPTAFRLALTMGLSYIAAGMDGDGFPVATVEDPRYVIHAADPLRPAIPRAAVKLEHDDDLDEDRAWLWLPGRRFLFRRDRVDTSGRRITFDPNSFALAGVEEWDEELGVPVVPIATEDGLGVFEPHLGHLERIDKNTFRRDTIALLQAFRQRALVDKSKPDDGDVETEDGESLSDVLTADPAAVWTLPRGVELWESGQVDLQPLQMSKRDDVKDFCAVTATPLSMVTPDAAAQTAEGASLQREGITFAVEDLRRRVGGRLARVVSALLRMAGEVDRSQIDGITIEWMPAERHSLGERAQAAVSAQASGVPWRTRNALVWQFTPEEIARAEFERTEDLLFDLSQQALAPTAGPPAISQQPTEPDADQ